MEINHTDAKLVDAGTPAMHITAVGSDGWTRMMYRTDDQWYVAVMELQNSRGARVPAKREDIVRLSSEFVVRKYEESY